MVHTRSDSANPQRAVVYRMVMDDHVCPYGIKTIDRLEREGFDVEDHWLESREQTDAFKAEHDVETTPQIWLGSERVGGYDSLREHLGDDVLQEGETTYRPVLAIFAVAAALAIATTWWAGATSGAAIERFFAFGMALLGLQKLQDVESFSTMFLNYDLLARRWVPYGYFYPYGETLAGVLMVAGVLPFVSGPIALFIGTVGAASVAKAVWIDGRELKCACVGGGSDVPLGFISLSENLAMIGMGLWTLGSLFR